MRINISTIYRIETLNSTYEIKVLETEGVIHSVAKRIGADRPTKHVSERGTEYLEKLVIGAGFHIPGCWEISNVTDYSVFVLSDEPKRRIGTGVEAGIHQFFDAVTEHVVAQVRPHAVVIPGKEEM